MFCVVDGGKQEINPSDFSESVAESDPEESGDQCGYRFRLY